MNADVVVPQELSTFHTICAITAIEANSSQPNNELITKLNISAKNAMLLEGLPSKNRQMIMQMSLFIVRKSIEAIVKYGLTQPIDSLREFLENICAFYRSHDAIGGINEEVSSAILRIISNVCMLLEKPMGIPTLDSLFRVLNKLVSTVVEVDVLRKELSSSKRMPLAAAIVHICLELFQATNRDVRIRLSAARVLRRFIVGAKRSDNVYQVAFVLPGILSRTHKVATTDQNSFILLEALLIAANAIEATMNNKVFDRERAHKSDEATAECGNGNGLLKGQIITIAAKPSQGVGEAGDDGECGGIPPTDIFTDDNRNIIGNTMKQIAARLCGNVDFRVRMCVIDCIKFVYVRCVRALGKAIEKTVEDVGTLLLEDKYKCIREKSIALLRLTRNKALKEESLKRKLLGLCRAIKIQIWQNGDIQMPFQQMCGMLLHAKVTDLSEILKSDGKAFEELIECFASCAVVNRSAMELVVEVDENFKKLDFCSRIRLRSGIGISDLKKLCYKLIKCDAAGSAMLYCESKMAFTSSVEQRLAFEIISLLIMCEFYTELRKGGRRMLHDFNVESVCKSIIDRFSVELDGADFIETAVIGDYDTTVVRRAVDICIMGAAFRCIGSKERRYRLLSRCMLHVLEWRTSAVRLISIAAEEAACDLAKGMEEPSVSMLCFKYANTLLSHICVSGEAWQLVRSARLVTSLLDLCNEKAFFETACLLNGQMISLLDRSDASCKPIVLRAMISFVVDVAQWFPDEKEPEDSYLDEEENDDSSRRKRRVPQFVSAVEVILKRTKHLTSSRELKIRLLVLKLIELAVLALTHFSNTLCPLVHENWPGVKLNANGDNFLARKHALKVIVAMCQITGSFMYRRFTKEIWPSLQESMTRLLADAEKRSGDGTIISESYKYQRSVLKHLVTIWENIEPLEEDWNSVRHILSAYSCSPFIHKDLVVLAKKSLEKLVEIFKRLPPSLSTAGTSECLQINSHSLQRKDGSNFSAVQVPVQIWTNFDSEIADPIVRGW